MVSAVGPRDEQTVRPKHESVVLRDVVGRFRVANHLLQLVLVLALVHVLLGRQVGRDLVRYDQIHLVAVRRVAEED